MGAPKPWQTTELSQLKKLCKTKTVYEIAPIMNRSVSGIRNKLKREGLKAAKPPHYMHSLRWRKDEIAEDAPHHTTSSLSGKYECSYCAMQLFLERNNILSKTELNKKRDSNYLTQLHKNDIVCKKWV